METSKNSFHQSVLTREVEEAFNLDAPLQVFKHKKIVDATLGTGGHSLLFINRGFSVLGIETDDGMIKLAEERIKSACPSIFKDDKNGSIKIIRGNFREIDKIAPANGFDKVDGVLFDLGVSNLQLTSDLRGFSFSNPKAPLDMRMDPEHQGLKASDLVNLLSQKQLKELFSQVLTGWESEKIARNIVETRENKKILTVGDFLSLLPSQKGKSGLHFSTLPFLALRVAVNSELENITEALPKAFDLLDSGGKLVVISFHSGEDRLVKRFFHDMESLGKGEEITKKPISAKGDELAANPRARSAKLRVLAKK